MQLSTWIRLWGIIDVCYVVWIVYNDLMSKKVPFVDSFMDAIQVSAGFELTTVSALTVIGSFVMISVLASGPLMVMRKKWGVYISLVQMPFRLLLVIPPTLFFLPKISDQLLGGSWIGVALMMIVEIIKAITELLWLRRGT